MKPVANIVFVLWQAQIEKLFTKNLSLDDSQLADSQL